MRTIHLVTLLLTFFGAGTATLAKAEKNEGFLPGYIILGVDTIKGFVLTGDHALNTRECTFKETATGAVKTYTPDEVKAYGVTGKSLFYAATIQTDYTMERTVFLECVVKSKVSLFVYRDQFFLVDQEGRTLPLVEEEVQVQRNGKSVIVKRPLFKSTLQKQMEDCATIHEKLVDTELNDKSLVTLFKGYASCAGHEAVVFNEREPKFSRTRYGFTVGVLIASLDLEVGTYARYSFAIEATGNPSVTFTPSFFMDFGISRKFDLSTGLTWYYTRNELLSESSVSNLTHNFSLEVSRIEVPILVKFNLSEGNIKWSLKGGGGFNAVIKHENKLTVSTTSSGYLLSEYTNDLKKNSLFMNAMGGVAAEFLIGNRPFVLEGFYSKSGSLVASGTHAKLDAFKVSVGMYF